jgi:hypothetical protein
MLSGKIEGDWYDGPMIATFVIFADVWDLDDDPAIGDGLASL